MKAIERLNKEQKQLLADVINYGYFGDSEVGENETMCEVFVTDDAYKGNHFERKSIPNRLKDLYKALGLEGSKWSKQNEEGTIFFRYDWWGDGTGSILAFSTEISENVFRWAKENR